MHKQLLKLLLVNLIWFSPIVQAQSMPDLYQAQVTLKDRSEVARRDGFKRALTQVLIKLSGDRKRPLQVQATIQNELRQMDSLVTDSKYLSDPDQDKQVLSVHFAEAMVNELLGRLKLPIWNQNRPTLLGWVMLDTKEQRAVINEELQPTVAGILIEQARQRGIPLLFPILDLDDLATLKLTDVMSGTKDPVMKIAKRYGVTTVLVGWVWKTLDGWQGQWHLYVNEEDISFSYNQLALPDMLGVGLNWAVDEMAKRLSQTIPMNTSPVLINTEHADTFDILVTGGVTLQNSTPISEYLGKLEGVEEVQMLRIQAGEVKYRMKVKGGKAALRRAISLGTVLVLRTNQIDDMVFHLMKR